MIDPEEFRRVMGHFPAGVAVVTTVRPQGGPAGLTASAVCSVSLRPTLVLACVDLGSESHRHIEQSGVFAINVLGEAEGAELARRFSRAGAAELKFQGVRHHPEQTGAPVLDDALAWLDCRVQQSHPAGDHSIFVGQVEAAGAREGAPLLYFRGRFGRFGS
jgi:3-hydroxy-9,10-secoandrosta-1,3,5(10)-triene-9,17-dione monooxygenase reductase component